MGEKQAVWVKTPTEIKTFEIHDSPIQYAFANVRVDGNKVLEIKLSYGGSEKIVLYPRPLKLLKMLLETLEKEGYKIYE